MTVIELKKKLDNLIKSGHADWEVEGHEEWFDGGYKVQFKDESIELNPYDKIVIFEVGVLE